MNKLIFCVLIIFVIKIKANDILGCGGFIKSHVQIDYSKVEIRLYTKQGILKDKTFCAPNNGYYFIPLYDKGDYVLQLEPPPGWSFSPTKVQVSVDGKTDLCSQGKDINFVFKGFGITGKVESQGNKGNGPVGVKVMLKSDAEMRTTVTSENGVFFFTPVFPGQYIVSISHPKWKILKQTVNVIVTEGNTELPPGSLLIKGYDVMGHVEANGEAVFDAYVFIFKKDGSMGEVEDCEKSPVNVKLEKKFLCYVRTDKNGKYIFPTVSHGNYYLKAHYKNENIHLKPSAIDVSVKHDSVFLDEKFEIIGLTILGKVLDSKNGSPLPRAEIFLNNKEVTKTNSDGLYKIENIEMGRYTIQAKADNVEFEKKTVLISPTSYIIDDIFPSTYKVCGEVVHENSYKVGITNLATQKQMFVTTEENTGNYCHYLSPGNYRLEVKVNDEDKYSGIQFFPVSQNIIVKNKPIYGITFSQLRAKISGSVKCFKNKYCERIKVVFRTIINDIPQIDKDIFFILNGEEYNSEDIKPGVYEIFLTPNRFCWEKNKFTVTIMNSSMVMPQFKQTGFNFNFFSSHEGMAYYSINNTKTNLKIAKGKTSYCLVNEGVYTFNLEGCHIFEKNKIVYDTSSEQNQFQIFAKKHENLIQIYGDKDSGDLYVTVEIGGIKTKKGPLVHKGNYYELSIHLSPSEIAILTPHSDSLYFNPLVLSITGGEDCTNHGKQFKAIKGIVFSGRIKPALADVEVTIEGDDYEVLTDKTNSEGKYKFPPLDSSKLYRISAKKNSYVLNGPDEKGDFTAHKLAEITVEVVDENSNLPLQGALLSLSGGESYRSNLQTNEDGKITFDSLTPSEYFLRPMMKEYSFEPNSKIINVKEGSSLHIQLRGKRVAYSAFGQIISLNGDPEKEMIMVAKGKGNCSQYSEEATSETNGHFRIRGLLPYCSYEIVLQGSVKEDDNTERTTPSSFQVQNLQNDMKNLKFIALRPLSNTDVIVKVYSSNPEHYKSLRLMISRESSPSGLLHSMKLDMTHVKLAEDNNPGVIVQIPSIPLDSKLYFIQLESALPQFNAMKPIVEYFTSNTSIKYIELEFIGNTFVVDHQIKQTSIWTLLFIFAVIIVIYNVEVIVQFVSERFTALNLNGIIPVKLHSKSQDKEDFVIDTKEIDQIVQNINVTKRKVKPKKI